MQWLKNQYTGFGAIILLLAVALVLFAKPLAVVLFVSILFAALLGPLVDFIGQRAGRSGAIVFALAGVLVLLLLTVSTIIGSLLPSLANLVVGLPAILQRAHEVPLILAEYFPWIGSPEFIQIKIEEFIITSSDFVSQVAKAAVKPLLDTSSQLVELISVPLLAFYWLRDGKKFKEKISQLFPQAARHIQRCIEDSYGVIGAYVRGMIAVSVLSGIAVLLFGVAVGIQHMVIFSFLSFLGEWIPVIGPIIAAGFALCLMFVQGPALALKGLIFYAVMFKLNHNFVYPALVGKATRIHPIMIMIGVLFAGHVGGIFGMMVVVPVMAVVRVFYSVGHEAWEKNNS